MAWSYRPVSLLKSAGRALGVSSPNRLRVLLYHDVPPESEARFASQLRWLQRRWRFVTPDQFAGMVSGAEPVRGANLLLTFDDGFASNRVVAERILAPMNIRAVFFAVSEFVAIQDHDEARRFISTNIEIGRPLETMGPHLYNMGWPDLAALLEQGHVIGGHTRTHARLSTLQSASALEEEIASSADMLQQRLGVTVDHFAYTFGNLASFSDAALRVARQRFRFVYSGLRGDNSESVSPIAIRREAVGADEPLSLVGAFLEGVSDFHYASSRAQLDAWARAH